MNGQRRKRRLSGSLVARMEAISKPAMPNWEDQIGEASCLLRRGKKWWRGEKKRARGAKQLLCLSQPRPPPPLEAIFCALEENIRVGQKLMPVFPISKEGITKRSFIADNWDEEANGIFVVLINKNILF